MNDLEKIINDAWNKKEQVNQNSDEKLINTINQIIEDIAHNLKHAKFLGMKTVWLENDEPFASKDKDKPYIDYKIKSLPSFLQKINILKAA